MTVRINLMSKNDILIKVNQLYKIFGDNSNEALDLVKDGMGKDELLEKCNCVLGLNNINLDISKAKIQVVMGLSGSGKSTLIRHLNRLIEPTSGEILVNEQDILSLSQKELVQFRQNNMSMVFQKFALFPHKTVLQNVGYGLAIQNIPVDEEATFSSESNISNKPVFAIHERKKDYYCYVCKINFQSKATLDFHNQSLHEKKKSGKLYFASKRKSFEIKKPPIAFPLAKKSKENISAEQTMTENSAGKNEIIYKRQQMAVIFERKFENKNWDQNQNSCSDCKKNFSSRQDLKQHNNIF